MFAYLQDNYKCVLYSLYVVNAPASLYVPWKIIKGFLDETTIRKIHFEKGQLPHDLFKETNREQIEKQYGGAAPNVETFW